MMGVLDACAWAMTGGGDVFDQCVAIIEGVEDQVKQADIPDELHPGGGLFQVEPHFCNRKQEYLDELEQAKQEIYKACQVCQRTLAELP